MEVTVSVPPWPRNTPVGCSAEPVITSARSSSDPSSRPVMGYTPGASLVPAGRGYRIEPSVPFAPSERVKTLGTAPRPSTTPNFASPCISARSPPVTAPEKDEVAVKAPRDTNRRELRAIVRVAVMPASGDRDRPKIGAVAPGRRHRRVDGSQFTGRGHRDLIGNSTRWQAAGWTGRSEGRPL